MAKVLTGTDRELGTDLSRYQGFAKWDVFKSAGVLFAGIRSTISWGYQDPTFPHNWIESRRVAIPCTPYHVVYPKQDPLRQMDNLYKVCPAKPDLPRALDLELAGDGSGDKVPASPSQQAVTLWKCAEIVQQRDGEYPIIYTRYILINQWLASWTTDMLNQVWWWLAQYPQLGRLQKPFEHPGPPTLPNRVRADRVLIHQTSDRMAPFPGSVSPYDTKTLDRNRWVNPLPLADFLAVRGADIPKPKPTPKPEPALGWKDSIDAWARTKGYDGPKP